MGNRWSIGFWLAMLLLCQSCATSAARLPMRPLLPPVLKAQPIPATCTLNGVVERCVKVLESDWKAAVVGLQAACLASGGSAVECGTEPPTAPPVAH